ncbi:hypothetical protein SAVIM338S_01130 [Streptomyces avidinii]
MTTPEARAPQPPEPQPPEPRPLERRAPEQRPVEPPLLTLHAAVVLVGFTAGGLSHLGGVPGALAVLAGLGAGGGAVPVLRGLIR